MSIFLHQQKFDYYRFHAIAAQYLHSLSINYEIFVHEFGVIVDGWKTEKQCKAPMTADTHNGLLNTSILNKTMLLVQLFDHNYTYRD